MTKTHTALIVFLMFFWSCVAGLIAGIFTPDLPIIVAVMAVTAAFTFLTGVLVVSLISVAR
jgi:hypothetical protein